LWIHTDMSLPIPPQSAPPTADSIAWTEVEDNDSDRDCTWDQTKEEADEEEGTKKPLLQTPKICEKESVSKKQTDFRNDRLTACAFVSLPSVMIVVHCTVMVLSTVGQIIGVQHGEECSLGLNYFLRAVSLHAGMNVVLFILYLRRMCEHFCSSCRDKNSKQKTAHKSLFSLGSSWYDFCIEKSIVMMMASQVLLGVGGEIWIGGMGMGPALLSSCLRTAPLMYTYAVWLSVYENSVFLFLFILLLRKLLDY